MGFYDRVILPRVVNCVCGMKPTSKQREKVVPLAAGNVLEIGIGSGLNLPYYNTTQVDRITGIDPSPEMWELNAWDGDIDLEYMKASAEELQFKDNTFDSVVCTYTLCSIPDPNKALQEIKRVLKPEGKFIFTEHGLAPDEKVSKIQNRINPFWKKVGGGCHLNRNIESLISNNNMNFQTIDKMYIPGWKPASFNYWGVASAMI